MNTKWKKMIPANLVKTLTAAEVREAMQHTKLDFEATKKQLEEEVWGAEYFINDLYQVCKRQVKTKDGTHVPMVQLNIRRRDGKPIFRDWRHFQWIKNELVGEECEAVELYPAESRLVDTSNKYHLWCFTDPNYRLPFGMTYGRDVIEEDKAKKPGHRQRRM
jgi:hypothetical protein